MAQSWHDAKMVGPAVLTTNFTSATLLTALDTNSSSEQMHILWLAEVSICETAPRQRYQLLAGPKLSSSISICALAITLLSSAMWQ